MHAPPCAACAPVVEPHVAINLATSRTSTWAVWTSDHDAVGRTWGRKRARYYGTLAEAVQASVRLKHRLVDRFDLRADPPPITFCADFTTRRAIHTDGIDTAMNGIAHLGLT